MQIRTLVLALAAALTILAGCKKSSPAQASIVGAWSETSINDRIYIGASVYHDTTLYPPPGVTRFVTFGSNGFFTQLSSSSGAGGGAYKFNGNTIALFDTSHLVWVNLPILTLTANQLSIGDTVGYTGDTVELYIQNYTR